MSESPALAAGPDPEWTQYLAWAEREAAAGHDPDEAQLPFADDAEEPGEPAESGEPAPAAASCFAQDHESSLPPAGPRLAALTEQAITDLGRLSDDELIGVLQASQRQVAREHYKQVLVTAEFGRRRQGEFADAARRGVPVGCRPGGFPGEELAVELVVTRAEAGHRIDDAADLTTRLPLTLAGLAAGRIDADRAGWIALYTRSLTPADAAAADEILAAAAPELRVEQLAHKAAALEKKLNPAGVKARREQVKRDGQRVEARPEASGNASLAGREMDTASALASRAHIDALAARLHRSGLFDATLDQLRLLSFTDLTQGRNPLDRIAATQAAQAAQASQTAHSTAAGTEPAGPSSATAPLPTLVNLIVPAGTLLGWSAAPGQAGSWGLLDRDEVQAAVRAAALHPRSRWCVTLTGADGAAVAHGCARGQHPRLLENLQPQPPPQQLAELIRRLGLAFTPVTRDACDHAQAEDGYTPSQRLKHLVRARTLTCDAPGCDSPAVRTDLDHTVPWPDGPTDQCNLAPRCRTHHRAKQAPDWNVEQLAPGVARWTTPSGRTHITRPTQYDT
jgi:hypothetical protein